MWWACEKRWPMVTHHTKPSKLAQLQWLRFWSIIMCSGSRLTMVDCLWLLFLVGHTSKTSYRRYPLVISRSYWKLPFILDLCGFDLPIKNGDCHKLAMLVYQRVKKGDNWSTGTRFNVVVFCGFFADICWLFCTILHTSPSQGNRIPFFGLKKTRLSTEVSIKNKSSPVTIRTWIPTHGIGIWSWSRRPSADLCRSLPSSHCNDPSFENHQEG